MLVSRWPIWISSWLALPFTEAGHVVSTAGTSQSIDELTCSPKLNCSKTRAYKLTVPRVGLLLIEASHMAHHPNGQRAR